TWIHTVLLFLFSFIAISSTFVIIHTLFCHIFIYSCIYFYEFLFFIFFFLFFFLLFYFFFFFFQAEDGIRDYKVTGVQTCALPIYRLHQLLSLSERQPFAWQILVVNNGSTDGTLESPINSPASTTVYASSKIGRASCRERV